jgi:AraC-like DNA-binding protein
MATRETHAAILALIAACAIQGAIIALVQYYGVSSIRPLQALLATIIPPVAWAAFSNAAGGEARPRKMLWHATGFVLAVICLVLNPMLLDVLIPLSFAGYGVAMLLHLWRGEDSLLHIRLESGARSLLVWRIIAISLIASAMCDVLIAYGMAKGEMGVLLWVPSVVSSLSLFSLGILGLSHAIESRREHGSDVGVVSEEEAIRDQAIVSSLDDYMQERKPYLDADLTLARLSRRLIVPVKSLSAAINRVKNENVSRYVNRHRIEHACSLMAQGRSVTDAMFASGFNTKSNFNREFLRVKGTSPSKWQDGQAALLNNAAKPSISVIQRITERTPHD